jgi:hypothetical protein
MDQFISSDVEHASQREAQLKSCQQVWEQKLFTMESSRGIFTQTFKDPTYLPISFPRYFKETTEQGHLTLSPEIESKFVETVSTMTKIQQDWVYSESILEARDKLKNIRAATKM